MIEMFDKRILFGVAVCAACAGGAYAVAYPRFYSPEARFLAACDEAITGRLKSPSSYKRIKASELDRRPASLHEFMGTPTPDQVERSRQLAADDADYAALRDSMSKSFRMGEHDHVSAMIEYDADNSFGVALRGLSECASVVQAGEDPSDVASWVTIDGYTPLAWSVKQLIDSN